MISFPDTPKRAGLSFPGNFNLLEELTVIPLLKMWPCGLKSGTPLKKHDIVEHEGDICSRCMARYDGPKSQPKNKIKRIRGVEDFGQLRTAVRRCTTPLQALDINSPF